MIIRRNRSYSASDLFIPTHFSVPWCGLSSVCRLSHSCTLLKPFDGFRCHLPGSLHLWVLDPQRKRRFGFFSWPHISGLLTLRWPFSQYVLCLYFYVTACTSMPFLVDELNK